LLPKRTDLYLFVIPLPACRREFRFPPYPVNGVSLLSKSEIIVFILLLLLLIMPGFDNRCIVYRYVTVYLQSVFKVLEQISGMILPHLIKEKFHMNVRLEMNGF
jgi:hypothetical protein